MRSAAIVAGIGMLACSGRTSPAARPSAPALECPIQSDPEDDAPPIRIGDPTAHRCRTDESTESWCSSETFEQRRDRQQWRYTSCRMPDGTFHGPWRGIHPDGRTETGAYWYGCVVVPGEKTRPCDQPAGPWPYWHDRPGDPE